VSLDDKVATWLPDLPHAIAVTLGQLAQMTSGYAPGTNWNYAHTNYVILGMALARITGQDLSTALQEKVLTLLGLHDTTDPAGTAIIAEPALHAFSSERRQSLSVPASTPLYEESTHWNPS
jgi:CubicO group peptidase (beta-lactamase class C family)